MLLFAGCLLVLPGRLGSCGISHYACHKNIKLTMLRCRLQPRDGAPANYQYIAYFSYLRLDFLTQIGEEKKMLAAIFRFRWQPLLFCVFPLFFVCLLSDHLIPKRDRFVYHK